MVVLVTCKNEEDLIKNEGARVVTRFPPLYPYGAICCHGNQSSDPISAKISSLFSPTPMMFQLKYDCDRPFGWGDIPV